MHFRLALQAGLLVLLAGAVSASEPDGAEPATVPATAAVETLDAAQTTDAAPMEERRPSWGLSSGLGFGSAGGDFGDLLTEPVTGDFNIFRNHGAWRFGVGLSFSSFNMTEPFQDEKEWGFQ